MTKPQKLPVEEARKKFADLLDGSQFRGEHTEITRRSKPAGFLVPPEWYAAMTEQSAEVKALRKEVAALRTAAPAVATPRVTVTQAVPAPKPPEPEGDEVELPEAEVKRLVAMGRLKAIPEQQERVRRAMATATSLNRDPDIAALDALFEMGLLTDDDVQR